MPEQKKADALAMRFFSLVIDHPWWVIALLVVSTAAAGLQLPKMRILTDLRSLLPLDQVYRDDEQIRDTFGVKDYIIIGIQTSPTVFTPSTFAYVRKLLDEIEAIEGVIRVRSLFSEDNIGAGTDGSLRIAPFMAGTDPRSVQQAREQVEQFAAVQGLFVSQDMTLTTLLLEIQEDARKSELYFEIADILDKMPPPDATRLYISGMPVFEGVLGDYMLEDFVFMIPIVAVIVIVFLFFTYRSLLLVGLSFIMIFLVDIWTLGFMTSVGVPLYIIQCVMPVILMALSVADEIHLFGRYFEEQEKSTAPNREKVLAVMAEMWRPVVLTSVTTAFGFLALTTTSMKPLRYFGLFTAFGIFVAMLFALLATPVALMLFGEKERARAAHPVLDRILSASGSLMLRRTAWMKLLICAVIALSLLGLSRLYIQDSWISNFKKTSAVYTDDRELNRILSGTNTLYLELDSGSPGGIKDPAFLEGLLRFQESMDGVKGIGGSISIADIIVKLNRELRGQSTVPQSPEAIAQYLLLLEGSTYERFWDYDYQKVNIVMFVKTADYQSGTVIFPAIKSFRKKHLPDAGLTLGGEVMLSFHWVNLLRTDQIKSFLTSLVLIFFVSFSVFFSLRKACIVTAPIVLAVAMNYAIMGFCGIPLSVAVSIFSSIIMGIGIDYAIHLQSKYDILSGKLPPEDVLPGIFLTAGKAVLWNAFVVVGGFLTLTLSNMPPNQKLGIICSLGIFTSAAASFLVIPVFLIGCFAPRQCRDLRPSPEKQA